MAIYEFNDVVRAERRLEGKKARLSAYVARIPESDMPEYVRISNEIDAKNSEKP